MTTANLARFELQVIVSFAYALFDTVPLRRHHVMTYKELHIMNAGFSLFSPHRSRLTRSVIVQGLLFGVVAAATAQEAPVIINQETGAQVDLTRPYWNANVDIANRRIQCDHYSFNQLSGVYEKIGIGQYLNHGEFFHHPLFAGGGWSTVDHGWLADYTVNYWEVTDGVYSGMAPIDGSAFVETVTYNTASSDVENNAVRRWYASQETGTSYHVCYDLAGEPLVPTGSEENGNTNLLPEKNFTFQLPVTGTPLSEVPAIVRRDTGDPVEFVRAEFDYNGDLKGKSMNCGYYGWNEERGRYEQGTRGDGSSYYTRFYYAYPGGATVPVQAGPDDSQELTRDYKVDDFLFEDASYIEIDGSGYNTWGSDASGFTRCEVSDIPGKEPFAPNRILSIVNAVADNCDYTDADNYDGWGFDSITMTSCPPLTDDNSVDEMTDLENMQGSGTNVRSDVVQVSPGSTDNLADATSDSENTTVEDENISEAGLDDGETPSTDNEVSNTADAASSTNLNSTDETNTQSGGGSFMLPLFWFALALRRSMPVVH